MSPEGSVITEPAAISIPAGENATFNCSGMGGPDNMYTWSRVGSEEVVQLGSELTIMSVEAADGGLYQCTVSNQAGSENSTSALNG